MYANKGRVTETVCSTFDPITPRRGAACDCETQILINQINEALFVRAAVGSLRAQNLAATDVISQPKGSLSWSFGVVSSERDSFSPNALTFVINPVPRFGIDSFAQLHSQVSLAFEVVPTTTSDTTPLGVPSCEKVSVPQLRSYSH